MAARLVALLGLLVVLGSATPAHADVRLTIEDGKVSLMATGATLREILAEWERVGGTRIINAEGLAGAPLDLQLDEVPEPQALGILLRQINGYIAAPRSDTGAGASRFDRIMIMPGTPRPRVASMAPAPFPPPPTVVEVPPPFPLPEETADDPNAERPVRTVPAPATRGGVFGVFPTPADAPPVRPSTPAQQPATPPPAGTPAGVSVPGMLVPAPPTDQEPRDR